MKKRYLSLALAGILAFGSLLAGCGGFEDSKKGNSGSTTSASEKVLRVAIQEDLPTFDPAKIEDNQSSFVGELTYSTLYKTGKDGKPVAEVAEKYDVNEDGTVYTFTLKDTKWSNGDTVLASDYKYAWLRAIDPKTASTQSERFFPIKNAEKFYKGEAKAEDVGLKVVDDKTLEVTLESSDSLFVDKICYPTFAPLNEKAITNNEEWLKDPTKAIFNGPFKLNVMNLGSKLELVKNDTYFNKDKVKLDKIDVQIIKDQNSVYELFNSGQIDILGSPTQSIPADKIEEAKTKEEYQQYPYMLIQWAKFNVEDKLLQNVHLRRALSYAVDRGSIIKGILKDNGQVAVMGFNPDKAGKADYWKDHDVEAAKKELDIAIKELGLNGPEDIKLEYRFNTNEDTQKIIQVIQETWKKDLGINVELKNEEWKVYLNSIATGNYQIGRLGWIADVADVSDFLNMYQKKDGGNNQTNWYNEEFDKLIEQAKSETDQTKRMELLDKAEAIMVDEMPVMPLYTSKNSFLVSKKVKNFNCNLLGRVNFAELDIE